MSARGQATRWGRGGAEACLGRPAAARRPEEPGAGTPHVGIGAGAGGPLAVLPRWRSRRTRLGSSEVNMRKRWLVGGRLAVSRSSQARSRVLPSDSMRASEGDVRRVSEMGSVSGKWAAKRQAEQVRRVSQLEGDVAWLARTLQSVLAVLVEQGVVSNGAVAKKLSIALSGSRPKEVEGAVRHLLASLGVADST
jgi:hypothetical protein